MAKPKTTIIDETYSKGRQSTVAIKIVTIGTFKVRFTIKSDSYDFQSHAKAEIFNFETLSWNNLHHIPFAQMKTPIGLVYKPDGLSKGYYSSDFATLNDVVTKILF